MQLLGSSWSREKCAAGLIKYYPSSLYLQSAVGVVDVKGEHWSLRKLISDLFFSTSKKKWRMASFCVSVSPNNMCVLFVSFEAPQTVELSFLLTHRIWPNYWGNKMRQNVKLCGAEIWLYGPKFNLHFQRTLKFIYLWLLCGCVRCSVGMGGNQSSWSVNQSTADLVSLTVIICHGSCGNQTH